jgi:hypothetical protein
MTGRMGWFEKLLSHRAERRSAAQFAAYRWAGSVVKQDKVKDISSSGVYLVTEERLPAGTALALTLQREGPLEKSPDRRITALARVVRCGEDGMGLTFVASKDPDPREWETLLEKLVEQTKPADMRELVRMAEALGFLSRICPGEAKKVAQIFRDSMSNHKVENAVGVALGAENLLASRPGAPGMKANPRLALRILEDGSCTDEGWLQQYWGGLLLSSCSADGTDESTLRFVELLGELTTIPIRILTVVCTRAPKVLSESGSISALPLACRIEEMMAITGSRELQIERDFDRLSWLGLIEKRSVKGAPTLLPSDEASITPSTLGMQLFACCNGHTGALQDFYAASTPGVRVAANRA